MQLFQFETVSHAMAVRMADETLSRENLADVNMLHNFIFPDWPAVAAKETDQSGQYVKWLGEITAGAAILDMTASWNPHDHASNVEQVQTVWEKWQTNTESANRKYSQLGWEVDLDQEKYFSFPFRFLQLSRRLELADTLAHFGTIIDSCIEKGLPSYSTMDIQLGRSQVYTIDWPRPEELPYPERRRRKYDIPLVTSSQHDNNYELPVSRLSLRLPSPQNRVNKHYELQLIDTDARGGAMCRSRTVIASHTLFRAEDILLPPAEQHIGKLAAQITTMTCTKDGFPGGLPVVLEAGQQDINISQHGVLKVMERFITIH